MPKYFGTENIKKNMQLLFYNKNENDSIML